MHRNILARINRSENMLDRASCPRRCGAILLLLLLLLQGIALDAKGKKIGAKSGSGSKAAKGSELKAKLASNEGAAALENRDLQTAIAKFLFAAEADPGMHCNRAEARRYAPSWCSIA